MSDDGTVARQVAEIGRLRRELATVLTERDAAIRDRDKARDDLSGIAEQTTRLRTERDTAVKECAEARALVEVATRRAEAAEGALPVAESALAAIAGRTEILQGERDRAMEAHAEALVALAEATTRADDAEAALPAAERALHDRIEGATAAAIAAEERARRAEANAAAWAAKWDEQLPPDVALQARIAEIEALCLAEPPADSGVTVVQYLGADGKVERQRYRATDGAKFRVLPEALLHQARLGLVDIGLTEVQAEAVLVNKDRVQEQLGQVSGT